MRYASHVSRYASHVSVTTDRQQKRRRIPRSTRKNQKLLEGDQLADSNDGRSIILSDSDQFVDPNAGAEAAMHSQRAGLATGVGGGGLP